MSSIKYQIGQFHVVIVQKRQRNVQKGVMRCKVVDLFILFIYQLSLHSQQSIADCFK